MSQVQVTLQLEFAINCKMHFQREPGSARSRSLILFLLLNGTSLDIQASLSTARQGGPGIASVKGKHRCKGTLF